jgi:hypothetical protein
MKRLFYVADRHGKPASVGYFEDKQEAKAVRDELKEKVGKPYFIANGPDHRHYNK